MVVDVNEKLEMEPEKIHPKKTKSFVNLAGELSVDIQMY